jgi:hypothetical protein
MLVQTTASYSGGQKILQRQNLLWDCPFNTQKSKTFNLGVKALENKNRAYYTLKFTLLFDYGWTTYTRVSTPFVLPKQPKEISYSPAYTGKMGYSLAWVGTTPKGLQQYA